MSCNMTLWPGDSATTPAVWGAQIAIFSPSNDFIGGPPVTNPVNVYVNDQTSAFVFIGFPGERVGLYRDANAFGAPGVAVVKSLDPNVHPPQAFPDAGSVVEIPRGDSEQDAISAVVFLGVAA